MPVAGGPRDTAPFVVRPVRAVPASCSPAPLSALSGRAVLVGGGGELLDPLRSALAEHGARPVLIGERASAAAWEEAMDAGIEGPADYVHVVARTAAHSLEEVEDRVRQLFWAMRAHGRRYVERSPVPRALVIGSSGGAFGFGGAAADGAALAAASGMLKTLSLEWPGARLMVADASSGAPPPELVARALGAWLGEGPVDVAWTPEGCVTTRRADPVPLSPGAPLRSGALVVATGGARGVTHRALEALARRGPLRVMLVGRTSPLAPWLDPLAGDTLAEKRAKARAALQGEGARVTPVRMDRWIESHERRVDVWRNVRALRRLGAHAEHFAGDMLDVAGLRSLRRALLDCFGAADVDVLLHGAGVDEAKLLTDKDPASFERVFPTKVRPMDHLREALGPRRIVVMGSIAGRTGNPGQTDYAAANECLASLARARGSGMLTIAWTAWDDVGMAMVGSIRKVLAEKGVDLLPAALGAEIAADLIESDWTGDVCVSGSVGALERPGAPGAQA